VLAATFVVDSTSFTLFPQSMAAPIPRDLIEVHRRYNRNSADLWESFANHRQRVTDLVRAAAGPTLAVLGAGNCNDLDLPALAGAFQQIHLADIDADALGRARARQPAEIAERLVVHAPVDLSGALLQLKAFARQLPTRAQLAALPRDSAEAVRTALPGPFHTVLSTGLLSQIMHSCRVALGIKHPHLPVVAKALATGHLRAMVQLLRPGGTGVLVTDTATSETAPQFEQWATSAPLPLLERLQKEEKLLSGTEPAPLLSALASDPVIAPLVHPPGLTAPGLWTLGQHTLLVYALVFKRRDVR
jgi:hypothetical protein